LADILTGLLISNVSSRNSRRTRRLLTRLLGIVVIASVPVLASCGPHTTTSSTAAKAPEPAGSRPSPISKMVCSDEAQREIAAPLGVTAVVDATVWSGHRYSCRYGYPEGSFVLSVQELSSWAQTLAYYRSLGTQLGMTQTLDGLGEGAFSTRDGSVVVRKDWKVLLVDVSGLPPQFGVPPTSSADVAVTVADVILACWSGD
jgi:hypothetical protein